MHRYQKPGMEGMPIQLDSSVGFDMDKENRKENQTSEVFQKFNATLHQNFSSGIFKKF